MGLSNKTAIAAVSLSAAFLLAGCTTAATESEKSAEEPVVEVWASMDAAPDDWLIVADHGELLEERQQPKLTTNLSGTCSYLISYLESDVSPEEFIKDKAGQDVETVDRKVESTEASVDFLSAVYSEGEGKMGTAYHVFEENDAISLTYACQSDDDWVEEDFEALLGDTFVHVGEEDDA